jgi:hypothetical protein
MHPAPGRRRRASVLLALTCLAALAAFVAACGAASPSSGGVVSLATPSPSNGASAAPSESVDPEVAIADFEACMKEHGVDVNISIAQPGSGGGGPTSGEFRAPANAGEAQPNTGGGQDRDPKALQEADAACRHLLPSGMEGDPNATMDPEMADKLLDFSKCMRDHGIDFPDPQFQGGGVMRQMDENLDPSSDEFQAAQSACGDLLPNGGPGVQTAPGGDSGGPTTGVTP